MIRSEALILRRFRHGETSLVVHAFTKEKGRVPFMAKGARSGGKRFAVPLVSIVLLEFIWKPSTRSELQLLREVSLLEGYGDIHTNLDKLAWAQAGIETLGRTLTGEEPHEKLFEMTKRYLTLVAGSKDKISYHFQRFRLLLLQELGYALNMEIPDNSGKILYFRPQSGGLSNRDGTNAVRIHFGSWKLLSLLWKAEKDEIERLRISEDAMKEIDQITNAAFRASFDFWKPLESLKLIQK